MQAQSLRQQTAVSPQQSLAVIKTLLSASFGCIAYLRNLLPEENFGEGRLTSSEKGLDGGPSQDSQPEGQRHVSGVTIKTVTRGFSTEADKLLNYLEHGIFHAIEQQYLKSFIFAIYLDNEDPNNIVEAYTYTITYHTVPGTEITVPILSLDDQLNSLSLNGCSKTTTDPVALATLKGRAPTLGDVKQSVKALIKNLILATQSLEPLPKRRFATFKLYYQDKTPSEYEPPFFRPGDPEKDKLVFTTHNKSEVPEKFSVGSVVTPYHGIDVQIQSVVKYIPNGDDNDTQFTGVEHIPKGGVGGLKGARDSGFRSRQLDAQRQDAEERTVAWNAEDPRWTDADAEGEDDDEFADDSGIGLDGPLGVRKADGSVVPFNANNADTMEADEADVHYFGRPEIAPSHVKHLRGNQKETTTGNLEPTQQLEETQVISSIGDFSNEDAAESGTAQTGLVNNSGSSRGVDTQVLKAMLGQSVMEWTADTEMMDLETQQANVPCHDSIESYSCEGTTGKLPTDLSSRASNTRPHTDIVDDAACACELDDGDDLVYCDSCQKWLHLWCMGYHSPEDPRLPSSFVCIPCRLQGDVNFQLIKESYPDILAAFMDLALFRRSIKLVEKSNPGSLKEFRVVAKCEASLAGQLWKRLEREGFIVIEVTETDQLGLVETRTRTSRLKAKKVKGTKQTQKYVFVQTSKKSSAYRGYFSPGSDAEKTMLGLDNLGRKGKSKKTRSDKGKTGTNEMRAITPVVESRSLVGGNLVTARDERVEMDSQTQADTQIVELPNPGLKRCIGSSQETARGHRRKKAKVSVVEGVDIEE